MKEPKKQEHFCKICGKAISWQGGRTKGYCNPCKVEIMVRWTQVPFETRIEILPLIEGNGEAK